MKSVIFSMSLVFSLLASAESAEVCKAAAAESSLKLFAAHYELSLEEAREHARLEPTVEIAPLRSPNGRMKYHVLETVIGIGKNGEYRTRMIYALLGDVSGPTCVLMGQEILDMSSL